MFVIGTAGHVDHGKSTLVKALTDIDPDRLPEEKEREMTVDLGFAWLTLPSGREVSVVDVPGHERFIKNMMAGVGAIDVAMLIVAADESVMPQTREHLDILNTLQIGRGLVAVTKADLVDAELVELVMAEVEDALAGTTLQGCPLVGVSAHTGAGMDELKAALDTVLDGTERRRDLGRPRLPIDRCFTISGFGTVVTGTLIDGCLAVGQEVQLAGSQQRARIRGLQSHKTRVETAEPGVRLAINLSGISRDEVSRGDILTSPGWLRPAYRVDALMRVSPRAPRPMRHNEGLTFHLFTGESPARVRLLDADRLPPGSEGWVQLLLAEPLPVVKGDYFVVRSAEDTLGGGQVADPNPRRRYRRFDAAVVERLTTLAEGGGPAVIVSVAEQWGPCSRRDLARRANLSPDEALQQAAQAEAAGLLVALGDLAADADTIVYSAPGWDLLKDRLYRALSAYHAQYPLRRGAPSQEIRSRLALPQPVFLRALARLEAEEFLREEGQTLRLPEHQVTLSPQQERQAADYIRRLESEPYSPPTDEAPEPELLALLAEQGRVVRVDASVVFAAGAYQSMTERIMEHLQAQGSITVAEARTLFNTSRKYILPLLERMDQQQLTRRVGDERVLR